MLRNYLVVAARALARHKVYSAINVAGLAVGLASCIVILLYVRDQLSYDRWLPDGDRIYRVETSFVVPGREPVNLATSPAPLLPALQAHFAEVEAGVRLLTTQPTVRRGDLLVNEDVIFAEPSFFDVLELPLIRGDRRTALSDTSSLVVSESMAKKWFGDEDPVGQVLSLTRRGKTRDMRVTGVLRDLPPNTHLEVDLVGRLDLDELADRSEAALWGNAPVYGYLKLRPGASVAAVRAGMPAFARQVFPEVSLGDTKVRLSDVISLRLMAARDIHLHSRFENQMKPAGDARMVATIAVVALLVLLVACINYTNLTTARAGQREREIGMRKVVGATRSQIVVQFLGESVLVAVAALVLALALVEVSLPALNGVLGTNLVVHYLGAESLLPGAAALVVVVGISGGLYPALYVSRFRPAATLEARGSRGSDRSARVRAVLVPVQFAVMIALLVCTAVVYAQTAYSRSLDLGFDRHRLLLVSGLTRRIVYPRSESLAQEVARLPCVTGAVRANHVPGGDSGYNVTVRLPGQAASISNTLNLTAIDYGFFDVLRIPLLAGRSLSASVAGDDATLVGYGMDRPREGAINLVIDDLARARLGFASAAAAVGKQIQMLQPEPIDATIVGVASSYRFQSTRAADLPTVLIRNPMAFSHLVVRYTGRGPEAMAAVESVWRRLLPDVPFEAQYLETAVAAQYAEDEARARIFAVFAVLAVIIACLGLLGMASFAAERRVREIGIRKVLGASAPQIVTMLLRQFSIPVLAANALAWPVAFWLMRRWLDGFAVRISLSPLFFVGAGLVALALAWGTVASHAWRVARRSPIDALRYE